MQIMVYACTRVRVYRFQRVRVDGCPGVEPLLDYPECEDAFLPLAVSDEIVRYHLTNFFDVALKGAIDESLSVEFEDAQIWTQ